MGGERGRRGNGWEIKDTSKCSPFCLLCNSNFVQGPILFQGGIQGSPSKPLIIFLYLHFGESTLSSDFLL